MRRAVTALIVTAVVVVLLASFKARTPALSAGVLPRATPAHPAPAATATPTATATATPTATAATRATGLGDAIQYPYGVLQVKATVSRGRLASVTLARFQPEPGRSQFIDEQAIPLLRAEALRAGSASIDVISGATYTSEAYARSLQSALDRAKA
jgi:uncharacterized protein with FMN-binding domain